MSGRPPDRTVAPAVQDRPSAGGASPGEVRRQPLGGSQSPAQTPQVTQEVPNVRVVLVDEAVVAERGEQVVVWFVRLGSGWVRAAEHPHARVAEERADRQDEHCPPGTIWRRTVTLELERGCLLRKTTSRPLAKRMSPMEHLMSGSLEKRRELREIHFRVLPGGRIERVNE